MNVISPVKRRNRRLAGIALSGGILALIASTPPAIAAEGGFLDKVERWQDEMSDAFRDTWKALRDKHGKASVISASVDLREQDRSYMVRLNLPDRDLGKVEVKLDGDTLRIVAPASGKAGHYEQTVVLPGVAADAEPRVERKEDDNLIVITVPKPAGLADLDPAPDRADSLLSRPTGWESDVLRSMGEMTREMDRIFDDAFREFRLYPEHKGYFDSPRFGSFVDLKEQGSDYVVTAYLPDREVQDVKVVVEGQVLRIDAKAESSGEADGKPSVVRKGHYSQLLTLPGPVDSDKMKVDRKEGVLMVTLPKAR